MQATGIRRLTVMGLMALSVAIGSGVAASPTSAQTVTSPVVRQYQDSPHLLQSSSAAASSVASPLVRQLQDYPLLPQSNSAPPPLVDAYPNGSSGNAGQSSGGVRPAVGDPMGTRAEIIEEVLWFRSNFLGFGDQGKLGALGCSMSTEQRKQELNAIAARYEYRNQPGIAETESCTAWFTVRR
jgi:hypothetical protein